MTDPRGGQDRAVEEDEQTGTGDNSLGRLLTLSDGVFAIAMTLLALDLKVPDVGSHPTDAALRHALADNASNYWSFLVSFYIIGNYWQRHHRLMRSVTRSHPRLVRDTLGLLLVVAAMPFPASLLGRYGGEPISLALYGAFNIVASLIVLLLAYDVRHYGLADSHSPSATSAVDLRQYAWNLVVFVLCIPAGYVLHSHGPWIFVLLAIPVRLPLFTALWRRVTRHRSPTGARSAS